MILSFLTTLLLATAPVERPKMVQVEDANMHVQGIAYDEARRCMYFSFTSRFIKTDLKGNVIGSVDRINGHIGDMVLNHEDGRVYASLECKNDEIGRGIANRLGAENYSRNASTFYVIAIDVDRIDRIGMSEEEAVTRYELADAREDYLAEVEHNGKTLEHRYCCSGIDGVTLAPAPGKKGGRMQLYVAYGIYSDVKRADNDYQVLLSFDLRKWKKNGGEVRADHKYFVRTGNTAYGVQNLAWDPYTGKMMMAVYKGKKENWPNYSFFVLDMGKKAVRTRLEGLDYDSTKHELLEPSFEGYMFKWGQTGLCPLGDGYYYISHNYRTPEKIEGCKAYLYRWCGSKEELFKVADQEEHGE